MPEGNGIYPHKMAPQPIWHSYFPETARRISSEKTSPFLITHISVMSVKDYATMGENAKMHFKWAIIMFNRYLK